MRYYDIEQFKIEMKSLNYKTTAALLSNSVADIIQQNRILYEKNMLEKIFRNKPKSNINLRLKPTLSEINNQKGAYHLLLVLVVSAVISLIMTGLLIISLIQTTQANVLYTSLDVYFAAEGALFETLQHRQYDNTWPPSLPLLDNYRINNVNIRRTINMIDSREEINIDAEKKGTKRLLQASLTGSVEESEESAPLDIVLVLDTSGSMSSKDATGVSSIERAKQAALLFIDIIASAAGYNQIGLVTYEKTPTRVSDLTTDFNFLRSQITPLVASGGTNIGGGISVANSILDAQMRPDANQVILLLSDGVPSNSSVMVHCAPNGCTAQPPSGLAPDAVGQFCTQDAIDQATISKSKNYVIFSVAIVPISPSSDCGDPERTKLLGELTLLRASSEDPTVPLPPPGVNLTYYYHTTDPAALAEIFADIAGSITTPGFFIFQELAPVP